MTTGSQVGEARALGVHSLSHVAFSVPDLQTAETFYSLFGLDVRAEGGELGLYTDGSAHRWATVLHGKEKRISHLTFGIYEEDLPAFRERLKRLNVPLVTDTQTPTGNGIWIRDPAGLLLELRVENKTSPDSMHLMEDVLQSPSTRCSPSRSGAPRVRPRRMAHAMVFTANLKEILGFYSDVLGLRLSDRSGYEIAFMHAIHGSDHHVIGFINSDKPALHHTSWEVGSIHEVGLGAMHMAEKGYSEGWGMGRHVLGSNYFYYVRDPWNSYAEYSVGIDYIPVGTTWDSGDHPPEDSFFVWGPNPPEDFGLNYESKK